MIDGTPNDTLASLEITQASTVPGDGTIVVTAQDGTTQLTYTVHFNLITGVDNDDEIQISIYPNPVSDKLHISGLSGKVQVEIINLIGEKVISGRIENNQVIETAFLKGGVYFAIIYHSNGVVSSLKFVKK